MDAYVVSDIFAIDQFELMISEIQKGLTVSIFYGLLTPAEGASMMVVDANGNEKISGVVLDEDQLVVVSGNGEKTASYSLDVLLSARTMSESSIKVYPNPVKDDINLEFSKEGKSQEIFIYDIVGKVIYTTNIETTYKNSKISLPQNIKNGIYFLRIIEESKTQTTQFILYR